MCVLGQVLIVNNLLLGFCTEVKLKTLFIIFGIIDSLESQVNQHLCVLWTPTQWSPYIQTLEDPDLDSQQVS